MEKEQQLLTPLLEDGDNVSLEPRTSYEISRIPRGTKRPWMAAASWLCVAQLLLFIVSLAMLIIGLETRFNLPAVQCVRKLSPYSPALDVVSEEYQLKRLNGTIGGDSPYLGRPTEQRLAQWLQLQNSRYFSINEDELDKIGAPAHAVKLPEKEGGGYMAMLEVFHLIHCVEELWKNSWPEFYQPEAGDETSIWRQHLDHCADMLRQKLMCDADTSVITYNWVKHISHPVPNFNVQHKCRDYDAIKAWSDEHQVDSARDGMYPKPADAFELDGLP